MNIYNKRYRPKLTSLGSGTPSSSTYLRGDLSWQTVTGSNVNMPDIEDALIMMGWEVYSQDIAFDDIYIDDFTDETGIDTGNSTATYSSSGSYYSNTAMVLISNSWEASVNNPTSAYCVIDLEPVDAVTLNTDVKAWISIDDGSNYEQITLESSPFRIIGAHNYIRGDVSSITARTDKTIRIKLTGYNTKSIKLHGWGCGVKYA